MYRCLSHSIGNPASRRRIYARHLVSYYWKRCMEPYKPSDSHYDWCIWVHRLSSAVPWSIFLLLLEYYLLGLAFHIDASPRTGLNKFAINLALAQVFYIVLSYWVHTATLGVSNSISFWGIDDILVNSDWIGSQKAGFAVLAVNIQTPVWWNLPNMKARISKLQNSW